MLEGPRDERDVRGLTCAELSFCGADHLVFVLDERATTYRDRGKLARPDHMGPRHSGSHCGHPLSVGVVGLSESHSHRSGIYSSSYLACVPRGMMTRI